MTRMISSETGQFGVFDFGLSRVGDGYTEPFWQSCDGKYLYLKPRYACIREPRTYNLIEDLGVKVPSFHGPQAKWPWFKDAIHEAFRRNWELCDVRVQRSCERYGWIPPGRCYQEQLRTAAFAGMPISIHGKCAHRVLGVPIPYTVPPRVEWRDGKWEPVECAENRRVGS